MQSSTTPPVSVSALAALSALAAQIGRALYVNRAYALRCDRVRLAALAGIRAVRVRSVGNAIRALYDLRDAAEDARMHGETEEARGALVDWISDNERGAEEDA